MMAGVMKVKVTYAKKRRRAHDDGKTPSSPLEALPPEMDSISRTEMVRRLLKRSRHTLRVTKCDDHTRPAPDERTGGQVKHSNGRVWVAKRVQGSPSSDTRGLGSAEPPKPIQRSSSITERNVSHTLESPFRPGTITRPISCSINKKPAQPRWSKSSRTVSSTLKENRTRRVSRKGIISASDNDRRRPKKPATHQHNPSTAPSSKTLRTPEGLECRSPNGPFVGSLPQFQSTPPPPRGDNGRRTSVNERSHKAASKNWEASSDELNLIAGKMWYDFQTTPGGV
ncbi:hypothetical protein BKA82DRAFT_27100 [Pisolithus tinctorius]|uniref:Uncharacterized protein n=1 Tax=Pisolithus tinctorius Marx 270 TaxID=870435 RepID=A0A0C3NRI2_PISTI|nr:hypothetical protein BKA82DRAFT_27100 [Pisolithus tinctorius]KIO03475.1 hypothetical protein M404DRAFT_27100 [Pisolithus tinctorius Marx 270]